MHLTSFRTEITKSHLNNHICQHRGMKTSRVAPSLITFLTSPCTAMTPYQVSSEIYGGFFYSGTTLTSLFFILYSSCNLFFFSSLISYSVFCHGSSVVGLLLSRFPPLAISCFSFLFGLGIFRQLLCKLFPFVCSPR